MSSAVKTVIFELPTFQMVTEGYPMDFLKECATAANLSTVTVQKLQVAVTEAITNSVEHGNLGLRSEWKEQIDASGIDRFSVEKEARLKKPHFAQKKIKITVQYSPESIDISVQDEGDGFVPKDLDTPAVEDSHGRGLFMIRSTMDAVEFYDDGRVIRMKKKF